MDTADLELALYGRDASHYAAELRYSTPNSAADVRKSSEVPVFVDWERLRALQADPEQYGALLTKTIFSDPSLQRSFAEAVSASEAAELTLRIQVSAGPSAARLHDLRWETLRHPDTNAPLFTSERLLLSRYLASLDWRPVRLTAKTELRALVVVANPSDVSACQPGGRTLASIDVAEEEALARAGLSKIPVISLSSRGHASLENIFAALSEGFEILYLVCHGALIDGEPVLWLEDERGLSAKVSGSDLITRLKDKTLRQLPRLVVLASCQSAGNAADSRSDDKGALASLGPQMAAAGVPAVLAMQGDVTMRTVGAFIPAFFRELQKDGQIDRAMAVARAAVLDHADWWVPVLFTRLKSGRLWYTPGFAGTYEKWPALLGHIRDATCTPIIGPGLVDSFLGSRRQIAERWAETYRFPLAPHLRDDLPQVAQYLAVHQEPHFPHRELNRYLVADMKDRYQDELRDMPSKDTLQATLDAFLRRVASLRRAADACEPHRVLAEMPLPIYITTNVSSVLTDALKDAHKRPVFDYFRWNNNLINRPSEFKHRVEKDIYQPSVAEPLVFHVLGHLSEPDSMVLTEDDYFRYLIGATENRLKQVPPPVLRALADTALLFLGYQLDDWNFRALFWTLIGRKAKIERKAKIGKEGLGVSYAHVAAQLDPEEGRIIDSGRARRYLEDYFTQKDLALHIGIYWGTSEHFARELHDRWKRDVPPAT